MPACAQEAALRITRADCVVLVAPGTQQGTAYRPGLDVRGQAVVPADLAGGGALEVPSDITVTLEVDLVERFGGPQSLEDLRANAPIGVLELRDGRAHFNGQPLDPETEANLRARCREALNGGG